MGRLFHTTPNVLHYRNKQRCGVMAPGHTFTIEPMICLGTNKPVAWPDKWTQVPEPFPKAPLSSSLFVCTVFVSRVECRALLLPACISHPI